jgi:hypothetical protein
LAGVFFARGFLGTTCFSAGTALGLAGALGFLTGAVATTGAGSGAISLALGNGQLAVGASTLYGASGVSAFGLPKKNSLILLNIVFSLMYLYSSDHSLVKTIDL